MSDKFLGVGGRYVDENGVGRARALRSDIKGNIGTFVSQKYYRSSTRSDSGTLSPGASKLSESKVECVILSATFEFPVDDIQQFVYRLYLYDPVLESDNFRSYTIPYQLGTNTPFITPSTAMHDGLFETVVNDSRKIVRLRHPVEVAGFRVEAFNRSDKNYDFNYTMALSERGF